MSDKAQVGQEGLSADERLEATRRSVSGRLVVAGMVGFAVFMVSLLWLYWELYTRPYRELQIAIAAEFPDSSPRVVGGTHKSGREGDPKTLRILVYIPLDGFNLDEESDERQEIILRLAALAAEHQELTEYGVMEIRLMQRLPEQEWRRFDTSHSIGEWRQLLIDAGESVDHWPSTTEN
ncbi:MAG: hypothetical protein R3C18_22680 [Planctomycetaceae bacterium]